jgi:signal transduction histidine kinase
MLRYFLLLLAFLTIPCPAQPLQSEASEIYNALVIGTNFKKNSLFGHAYLFSTAKDYSINRIKHQQNGFELLQDEIPVIETNNRYHWIRYAVRNESTEVKMLIADLRYNGLNDVCFYILDSRKQVTYSKEHYNSNSYSSQKPVQSRFFSFPLRLNPGESVMVYWRIYRKDSFIVLPLGLFDQEYFLTINTAYDFFLYLSLGVFTFTFLLSLLLYVFTKYRLLLFYSGYTLLYELLIASMEGLLTPYFHLSIPLLEDNTQNVFLSCLNFFMILFAIHFLDIASFLNKKIYHICIIHATLVLIFGIYLLLTPFSGTTTAVISAITLFDMLLVLSLVISALLHKKRIAFLYLIAIVPVFVSSSWMLLTFIYELQRTSFFYQSLPFLPFFEVVVLGIALGYKLLSDRNRYFIGLHDLQKQFTSSIVSTQDAERQKIAADLHEELGGTLATVRSMLSDLRFKIKNDKVTKELDELAPLIRKSSDDLKRISHNLMPPEFEDIGLANSLKYFIEEIPDRPTSFQFSVSGEVQRLPMEVEINAYRIVSEMVQNIFKHANAVSASVQLLYKPDFLRIVVKDDGNGDKAENSTAYPSGMGLKNSTFRADYIGANLRRESGKAGTFVILDIPYPSVPNDADEPDQDTAGR